MSLLGFINQRLQDLHRDAQAVTAQVNPFDNGRTYQTVQRRGATYTPQAPASVVHQVAPLISGVARSAIAAPAYFAKTDIINPVRELAAQASHNPLAYQHAEQAVYNTMGHSTGQALERLGGNAAQLGLSVALPGASKLADSGAERAIGSLAPKLVRPVSNVATGAVTGGAYNVSGAAGDGQLTRHNVLPTFAKGAVMGAALPLAGEGVRVAVPAVRAATSQLADSRVPLNETGAVGKNVKPNYQIKVADGQGGSVIKPVVGTQLAPYKGIDTFVHRPSEPGAKGWNVSEASTGLKVGSGATRAAATADAQANIEKAGVAQTKQLIADKALKAPAVQSEPAPAQAATGGESPTVLPSRNSSDKLTSEVSAGRREPSGSTTSTDLAGKSTQKSLPSNSNNFLSKFAISNPSKDSITKYRAAVQQSEPAHIAATEDITRAVGGSGYAHRLKSESSIATKLTRKPGRTLASISDTLGSTAIVPGDKVEQAVNYAKTHLPIKSIDDFRQNPTFLGYRGVHLDIQHPSGAIGEIQIHSPESFARKEYTHTIYDKWRKYIESAQGNTINDVLSKMPDKDHQAFMKDVQLSHEVYAGNVTVPKKYLDEAKAQIKSLSGTPAKVADKRKLSALKRSTPEDQPTPLKDLVAAKRAELEQAGNKPPSTPTKAPSGTGQAGRVMNRLTRGAKQGRQNVGPEVQAQVDTSHTVRSTKALQQAAETKAEQSGLEKTIAEAHTALQKPLGKIDDKTVADAQQAIERADRAGRTEDAVKLHDQLAEHLTKQGQSIQAASLFYKLSPQGQLYKALRDIKKGGGTVTPELEQSLREQTKAIHGLKPGDKKDYAQAKFQKTVADAIPKGKLEGALSVWKAGLLSGAKTQSGNTLSNATFAVMKKVSDAPAAAIDKALSLATGKRTKTFTFEGSGRGFKQGLQSGLGTLRSGIDPRSIGTDGKYDVHGELNFKNPVIQKVFGQPSNLVFRGMNAADQPFYYAAVHNNLHDMARAEAKSRKLSGAEATAFVKQLVDNPTAKMAESAKVAAQKAVLGQDSKVAASLSRLAHEHPSVQIIAPFIKVPTNFLTRSLDFTPVGAIKEVVHQVRGGRLDQRALAEALGEATTGSAVLYLGAEMANANVLSGAYPTDPKEQARWKAEGITPNSLKVGGKWLSLNYLGPLGLLLGAGKSYRDAAAQGNNGWTAGLASFGQNLTGQSFLSGFSSFTNALTDPGRYMTNLKNSEAGSLVPAWANDLANLLDNKQRQTSTVPQMIGSRVPLVRNNLPVKTDVYGNDLLQRTQAPGASTGQKVLGALDQAVNPFRPSLSTRDKTAVVAEAGRLHDVNPNDSHLQVTPTPVTSINVEGTTVKLNADQKAAATKAIGQAIQANWAKLIVTPEYKALSDQDKAKALKALESDTTSLAERQFVIDNSLGSYKKEPTKAIQRLGMGQVKFADYATGTQKTPGGITLDKTLPGDSRQLLNKYNSLSAKQRQQASYSDPTFDYKVLQAKYQNAQASGTLSKADAIKQQDALAKAKVGSQYSRDVRDLYGLTKDEIARFVTSDPNGAKYASQLQAYDQALYAAGITKTLKFKNGVASGSSSRTGRRAKIATLPHIKSNPYKASRTRYKQVALPKLRSAKAARQYKVAALPTNINAKLRKA